MYMPKKKSAQIYLSLFYLTLALFALTFSMALLWEHSLMLMSLYIIFFLISALTWMNRADVTLFIAASLFFQIGEIILAQFGAWTYNNPTYLGIPIWITLSWGYAAIIIRRFSISMMDLVLLIEQRIRKGQAAKIRR